MIQRIFFHCKEHFVPWILKVIHGTINKPLFEVGFRTLELLFSTCLVHMLNIKTINVIEAVVQST